MWNGPLEPLIYDDEDADALLAKFIALCIHHKISDRATARWPPEVVGDYAFKELGCKNIGMRGQQAGKIWFERLEVVEEIELGIIRGPVKVVETIEQLTNRALQIADDSAANDKDKLAAIRLAGELQEFLGAKGAASGGRSAVSNDNGDFFAKLAKALPN